MITQIHSDGIKTVVHTSKFSTDHLFNFLRRSGTHAAVVEFLYARTAEADHAAHKREHDVVVHCRAHNFLPS